MRLCQKGLAVQNGRGLLLAEAGRGPHRPCEAWAQYSHRNSSNHLCLVIKVPFLYVKMMCGRRCLHCMCGGRRKKRRERKHRLQFSTWIPQGGFNQVLITGLGEWEEQQI